MMRTLIALLLLLFAAPSYAAFTVVTAGDSLTATCGFCIPTYSTILGYENVAVIGSTSQEWRDSLYVSQMQPHLPADVATFLIGTNDAGGLVATPPAVYEANVQWFVDAALADGAGVVQILILPYRLGAFQVTTDRIEAYAGSLYAICAADPLVSCGPDLRTLLGTDPMFFQPDGIHPTADAQALIAGALSNQLATPLPEPNGGIAAGVLALCAISRRRR